MFKIVISIFVFGFGSAFAGGGSGHSFGGYYNSTKYGDTKKGQNIIEIPNSATSNCSENIKIHTKSNVRYKNWFYLIHDWKDGYASTKTTQCGQEVRVSRLQIVQYDTIRPDGVNSIKIPHKTINQYSVSYLKMGLDLIDDSGVIHTVHSVGISGSAQHINMFNDWGGIADNKTTPNVTVYEW